MKTIKKDQIPKLTPQEAEEILNQVFMDCYEDANSIPVEQLESYSNYRSEKVGVQRWAAIIAFIVFLIVPFYFVSPRFSVSEPVIGDRGLPVYTVEIENVLPIYSVTAVLNGYSLPICQVDKHTFTIEPTSSGKMEVEVKLFSKQWVSTEVFVGTNDTEAPFITGTSVSGDELYIYIEDDGSGVDYRGAYSVTSDGEIIYPEYFDEEEGYIEFRSLPTESKVHILDYVGNELTVTISGSE